MLKATGHMVRREARNMLQVVNKKKLIVWYTSSYTCVFRYDMPIENTLTMSSYNMASLSKKIETMALRCIRQILIMAERTCVCACAICIIMYVTCMHIMCVRLKCMCVQSMHMDSPSTVYRLHASFCTDNRPGSSE